MLTVHAYPQCMRAAVKGAAGSGLSILGVSVLTSMDDNDVAEAGFTRDTAGLVALRAGQAKAAGVGGLVCSPLEAEMVRVDRRARRWPSSPPASAPPAAPSATRSASWARPKRIDAGASHLVVGRPITAAADPAAAAQAILGEMRGHALDARRVDSDACTVARGADE